MSASTAQRSAPPGILAIPTSRDADGSAALNGASPAPGQDAGPVQSTRFSRFVQTLTVLLLIGFGPWIVYRACRPHGSDFSGFMDAGRYVLNHSDRATDSNLFRYLPSVDAAFVPLTLLPPRVSATLWYVLNIGCWFGLLWTIRTRLMSQLRIDRRLEMTALAALLGLPIAIDGFLLSSFHVPMLWLMVSGLVWVRDGKPIRGGMLLGMAVWLKLLPLAGVGYLVLKRRFLPAAVALLATASIDLAISYPAFGWKQLVATHQSWLVQDAVGCTNRQLNEESGFDEDRITNQSLTMLLRRATNPDGPFPELVLARLPSQQAKQIFLGIHAVVGLGLFLLLRRSGRNLTKEEWSAEIAVICLCTIWLSPVVWSYHFTAAVPGLAVLLSRYDQPRWHWTILGIWSAGLALFAWDLGRAAGHMFWATTILGTWLIVTMLRRPAAETNGLPEAVPLQTGALRSAA